MDRIAARYMSNEHALLHLRRRRWPSSAVIISFVGLSSKSFPGRALPLVVLWLRGADRRADHLLGPQRPAGRRTPRAAELEHAERQEAERHRGRAGRRGRRRARTAAKRTKLRARGRRQPQRAPRQRPGGTLQLAAVADRDRLRHDRAEQQAGQGDDRLRPTRRSSNTTSRSSEDGEEIAGSETIAKGETSVSADLEPASYTFLCTVPGHAEAGMQGTLDRQIAPAPR